MKKAIYLLVFASLSAITVSSCRVSCKRGSGHQATDSRKVAAFNAIEVKGAYKVILRQDSSQMLKITTDDNLMEYIEASVSDGKLTIDTKHDLCPENEAVIEIGVGKLKEIQGAGAVDFSTDGQLVTGNIEIGLKGACKITADINAADVTTESNGVGKINLKGQAASHKIEFSGTGELQALDFVVGNYVIETEGASDCKVNVLNSLIVDTKGAADIEYKGNPSTIKNNEKGSSNLKKID